MEGILAFLALVFAPLSLGIVFTAIVAGIFLGALYNYRLNIPSDILFHKAVAGWTFIAFIFCFRLATSFTGGVVPAFAGWLGIAILWGIYVGGIWLGSKAANKLFRHRHA